MNTTLKWKLVAGFVLAFLAGCATGGFFAASHLRHLRANFARHPHSLAERMRSRMQARLDLTPDQIAKSRPIFDKAERELENIRRETNQRVKQVLAETNRELAPVLTAAQQAKLETMEKQQHRPRGPRNSARRQKERSPP